jgi:biopolymer transport protein ExbD
MRTWPERRKRQARIEIIPMIDVMMFLLVFFVLISINVLPSLGLRITPPSSARTENLPDRKKVMLSLSKDGAVFVDGVAVDLAALPDRLRDAETQAKAANQTLVVAIAGDEEASLQHLVDVLDAMKAAGVTSSAIVAKPK